MTARRKLVAMLSLVDPADVDEVAAGLTDQLVRVPGTSVMLAVRDPEDPSQSLELAGEMAHVVEPYDISVHVTGSGEAPEASLGAIFELFDSVGGAGLKRDRCAALSGLEHTVVKGEARYVHLFLLRRIKGLTGGQFHRHWLRVHAELGHRVPGIRAYRQFHVSRTDSDDVARALGFGVADFDGLAETFCADHDAFRTIMNSEIVATEAIPDQRAFIDADLSSAALYKVVVRTDEI